MAARIDSKGWTLWLRALGLAAFVALLLGACSPATSAQQGITCSDNSDCGPGLACLEFAVFEDASCVAIGKECLAPCSENADCLAMGAGFTCYGCGATLACEPTSYTNPAIQDAAPDGPDDPDAAISDAAPFDVTTANAADAPNASAEPPDSSAADASRPNASTVDGSTDAESISDGAKADAPAADASTPDAR